jgi:hypothetical protein
VAPSLAAELWGISLEQVLQRTRSGELACCEDYGFFLVDVAPDSHACPPPGQWQAPPATFVPVSSAELEALKEDPSTDSAPSGDEDDPPVKRQSEDGPDTAGQAVPFEEWRNVRSRMSRLRVPPPKRACDA